AVKVGATFGPAETTPGFALQELNARGAAAIDRLLKEAQANSAKKDYAKAEAALTAAGEIAAGLGLFSRPIDDAKTALRLASGGRYGNAGAGGLPAPGSPDPVPLGLAPVSRELPKPVAPVASESKPAAPVATAPAPLPVAVKSPAPEPAGKVSGKRLLD